MTSKFIECLAPDACIGSPAPPFLSPTGQCALGYSGNLCHDCIKGFSRSGRFQCSRCPNRAANIVITVFVAVFALFLLAIVVWTAVNSAMKPQSLIAIYVKIFMNYFQIVVVSAALNLNWPTFAKEFLNGQQMAGGIAEQLFSIECLMRDVDSDNTKCRFTQSLRLHCSVSLLSLGVFVRFAGKFKTSAANSSPLQLSSSSSSIMFSLFACMDLGDEHLWLIKDLSIICWNSTHLKQVLTVVVPSLVVFVFGLPMLCLGFLVSKRRMLESPHIKLMLCFLYKGYHRTRFYWEFIILYRKVAMIAASVFLAPVSIRVQSLTVLAVLLSSLFLQIQVNPFFDHSLNQLEVKAILVSAITIYSGLYYDTKELSSLLRISFFTLILIGNVYFLVSWLRLISPVLFFTLREKFARIVHWRRKYRVQASDMTIPDHPEKSSAAVFSSEFSRAELSISIDHTPQAPVYLDPANTSVAQREPSEPRVEQNAPEQYTFVD